MELCWSWTVNDPVSWGPTGRRPDMPAGTRQRWCALTVARSGGVPPAPELRHGMILNIHPRILEAPAVAAHAERKRPWAIRR